MSHVGLCINMHRDSRLVAFPLSTAPETKEALHPVPQFEELLAASSSSERPKRIPMAHGVSRFKCRGQAKV